jgi:hypothetical protein
VELKKNVTNVSVIKERIVLVVPLSIVTEEYFGDDN